MTASIDYQSPSHHLADTRRPRTRWTAKQRLFAILAIGLGLIVSFLAMEIILRPAGFRPWHYVREEGRPVLHETDSVLSWRNKPGRYRVPPFGPEGSETVVTNWSGGRRATAADDIPGRVNMAVVGCSFTQGWAISDSETFAWKLQSRFPSLKVNNYGTAGYNTYQCLLLLERLFAQPDPPRLVVYGFIEHHESRNVAEALWLRIQRECSPRGFGGIPFCTLDAKGELVRHSPESYAELPLHEYLASVVLAERVYMRWKTYERTKQRRAVTERLLLEMDKLCRSNRSTFVMAFLQGGDLQNGGAALPDYRQFCNANGITFVNCVHPFDRTMQVRGEWFHPNGQMNALWSKDIASVLRTIVPTSDQR